MKVAVALNLAIELLIQAQKLSALAHAAQMKGKTELTAEEISQIVADRDAALARLDQAIAVAESKE